MSIALLKFLLRIWKSFKVPIYVTLGEERFKDGERSLEWLFKTMRSKNTFPRTSQPAPFDFERVYEHLLKKEEYDYVLSIIPGGIETERVKELKKNGTLVPVDGGFLST